MYKFRVCYESQGQGCGFDSFMPAYNAYLALSKRFQGSNLSVDKDICMAHVALPYASVRFWLEVWNEQSSEYIIVFKDDIYEYICNDIEDTLIKNDGNNLKWK